MSKTTTENLKDRQALIADIIKEATYLIDDLRSAESCEDPTDFDANIDEASTRVKDLSNLLEEALSE